MADDRAAGTPEGALTIVGDVAQATGRSGTAALDEVLSPCRVGDEATVDKLRHAYRDPPEIIELARPVWI